ncbi:RE1 [Symbiodinium sp. CCMP2592]|nr:RE1 [Symbiodinium sp. CCMP2592]
MASGSLAYRPHQDLDTDLTKFGFLVYAGTVRDFHEWEFRAMTRWKQTKVEDRSDLASKFLDSLRSEAYIVAEDLGTDVLFSSQNIPKVIEAVRERLFPLAEQETKELYRLGTQVGGMLSRQPGEPMISYIDRRKRWLRKLQQLDKALHISEAVLTDLLLDNSGLTRQERLMVLTSMSGSTATKDAEASLIRMHNRIHTLERKQPSAKGGTGKGKGFPRKGDRGKGKGYGKRSQKGTAYTYLSAVEDLFEYPDAEEDDDGTAYLAGQEDQDGQGGDGQDWAYHGAGFDEEDKEALAFLADTVQCETVAFMARAKAKGKGKSVMQKSAHGYRPRSTGLTVEDRRRKLHEIKLRSTCKTCGRKGHWAGDKECPGPGKGAGKPAVAHLAQVRRVMDKSTQTCDFSASPSESDSESQGFDPEPTANYVSLGQDSETEPAAYMGFFDRTDFEESDEELLDDFASQGAPSTEWDTIEYPDGSDQVFRFGMHRGSTYLEVLQNHPDYYYWGLKEKEPSTMLEAWLIWVYRNFEVPPVGGGRATLRAVTLPVEADSLQKARKEVTFEKAPKSKLGLLKADPKGPCVGGCPAHALNKAGSNAHVIKTTCMLCGTRTSNPRPKAVPKNDPLTCEHKRTDNRNSTRSVHRTFCLDCCTVVEEIPQKLFKEQKGLAEQVQQSPLKVQNLTRRQLEEYNFTKFEAGEVVKKFFKHMDKFLLKVDNVSSTELSSCLEDAMDQVVEQTKLRMQHGRAADVARSSQEVEPPPLPAFSPVRRERRSAQPREHASPAAAAAAGPRERGAAVRDAMAASPPSGKGWGSREKFAGVATVNKEGDPGEDTKLTLTALVGQLQKDDLEGDISPKSVQSSDSEPAPLDEEIAEPQLQLVDPLEDHENVWVMLDEGCNQTCHGTKWRAHSSKVLAKFGLQFTSVRSSGTSFKGIGAARATGKFAMPFALRIMPESGGLRRSTRLQGELSSVELDSPDVLCLLSLQDQVQLGLIKDLRRGECRISGYAGTLQLARHSKTGLLLLCVSQFGANVTERHRKFAVKPEVIPKRTSKKEKNTFSIPLRDGTSFKEETLIPSGDKDSTAYMLSEMVKEAEGQRKEVLVVTLGLEKVETCQRGRGTYCGLTELFRSMRKGQSHEFSLNNEAHEDTLLESLRQNFESFRDYATEQILFLDCRHMNDPGKDKSLRDHLGTYPKNVQAMVLDQKRNGKWVAFMKEVVPAVHKLIQENEETYEVQAQLLHLCDGHNWRYLCGGCAECNWESKEAKSTAEKVMDFALVRIRAQGVGAKGWPAPLLGDDGVVVEEPIPSGTAQAAGAGSTPQPDSAVKEEAAQGEQPGDKDHDEEDTAGAAEASASSKAQAQPFTVDTPDGVSVPVHDLRPELEGLDDKSLEKVSFLFLSRVYSVFNPAKLTEVTTLVAKYAADHTSLTCAVAAKYLEYEAAKALLSSLVADVRSGKRTEKEWDTDLELANRSLDVTRRVGHEGAGPPVRVSYRAHAAKSWDKIPTELQRYRKHVAIQWTPDGPWEWRETNAAAHSWVYFGDRWDQHPRHMLVFLVPPRGGSAFYVGGMLPDLMASDLKVMKKETGKMFEDSCKNLNTHDDLLMQALGLPSVAITGEPPTIFALASSEFQPGSLERTGAKVIVRHPGYRMILLEDIGWQKQISKEIAKIRPDLLLLVYSLEDQAIGEVMSSWANCDHDIHYSPVSIDTVGTQVGFAETLLLVLQEGCVEDHVAEAFPVEARQDEVEQSGTLDAIVDLRDNRTTFMDDLELAEEADILDTLPLAGFPKEESERRKAWSKVLRGAGASEELVNAAKIFKCESCRVSEEKVCTHPVSAPPPYEFNHTVSVDVLETADSTGAKFSWLNIIDVGTSYQVVTLVRVQKFMQHWVSPFGWPKVVSHDRGLHNRGAFAHGLGSHGVQIRQAGLESPEHIGKCERHGGIIKRAFKRLVKDHNVVGKDDVKVAMLEAQVAKNEFMRVGGFSPTQWVLGRLPRGVGHVLDEEELGQLGVLSGRSDATTAFGRQAEFRHTARKAFVHEDCSRRVRKTVLRKAAPLPGKYQAGDLVCYRIARDEHSGRTCGDQLGTTQTVHIAEVLAFQVLNRGNIQYEHAEVEREQQRYIDATGDDLVLDDPEEPPDGGIGIGTPIQMDAEADPPETAAAAPERAVRRRVGATREESRAVTVEEPEDEQVDPSGGIQEPMAEDTAVDADGEAEATEGSSALLLRAYASHFWTKEERTVWNSLPGEKEYEALRVFFADRVEDDKKVTQWRKRRKNFTSKKQKEKHGKILMYHKCPEDVQKELDKSRAKEWAKWQDFSAAIILDDAQYDELIREGHQVIPTQWVELDKNHNKRLLDPTVEANYKSRLVVRGDLEKGDPRSDSPTASIEAQNLVFSFAASRKVKIKSLDVTNAYFQGEEIDRVLLLSQPKGGLPGLKPHQHMLARAPIYGSTDGGRRFWKRLRNYLKGKGLRENRIYRALYSYTDADGVVQLLLTSHVDDLLWACDPSCDWIMNDLIETFKCGKVKTGSFRYCGKEISQDEDFNIHVTCSETTRNVNKIHVDKRRHPGDPLTDSDKTQMKSVAGSLAWVCRQCRPDLSYRVSKIQSASSNGTVADIRDANKAVEYAISTYDRGLVFKSGLLDWKTPGALLSLVITDASHANESEEMIINEMTSVEGHRSQGARMVFLTDGALWKGNRGSIHPILWASNLVRRVCRSTIQAEAYTLQAGVEDGDVLRAAVTDIFGCLDMKRWEATSAKTDCKSLELTLSNPKCNKHSDKRLSIEIASLRQELWRKAGEKAGDPFYDDYKPADDQLTDIVRWIDTDVMIADPLTKVMEPVKLVEALKTNTLDVEQPLESVVKKRAKQLQRRSTKKEEDNEQDR